LDEICAGRPLFAYAFALKCPIMNKYLSFLFLFFSTVSFSQPLRDINYEYVYNPDAPISFQLGTVRDGASFTVIYNLQVKDTVGLMSQYSIEWEGRSLSGDKEGTVVTLSDHTTWRHASGLQGQGTLAGINSPNYLVAKVVNTAARRAWLFYTRLQPNYPVNNYLLKAGAPLTLPFLHTNESVALGSGEGEWIVSHYDDNFPAAAPAFSETQASVSRVMSVDSVFRLRPGQETKFSTKGLYLIQKDTNAVEGVAFRSEEDYPQYSKVANLAGPLVYITTRQEYDRLEATQGNKKAFDRTILGIVLDTDRARSLMRSYFRRVELANRYFTSYKEGWKTDRGMTYIIFGVPDEVYKFDEREVWRYKNDRFEISFTFTRSSSLFDPDNYVLLREKKYEDTWYEVVDLWRNARF
jgi:GWxTD domain-containing protein